MERFRQLKHSVAAVSKKTITLWSPMPEPPDPATTISDTYHAIYAVVGRIPEGSVATYGQVAILAGLSGRARLVGYALSALAGRSTIPWQRVVNAHGRVSPRSSDSDGDMGQQLRLEHERVVFDANGRIPFERLLWRPGDKKR
jgi:methylated-DNA-protein-cysteine methyltransferase-like protein